jgi:hypothetical protein
MLRFCLPGLMRRARAQMMRPAMRNPIIVWSFFLVLTQGS